MSEEYRSQLRLERLALVPRIAGLEAVLQKAKEQLADIEKQLAESAPSAG
jgi:hypothetical protein